MIQRLIERLGRETVPINAALDRAMESLPSPVRPVARHILEAGGKRLRPFLTVLSARALDYRDEDIYVLGVSLEMLHAATLLHDDVLDNASLRRGRATAHTLMDVPTVILAGDALLAEANALVASFGDPRLTACFSEATSRTAAGEIQEMAARGRTDLAREAYDEIVRGKTAWLLRASCEMGGLRAGGDGDALDALALYGENLGMAFQYVDDALDLAPEDVTGKPTGGDLREGKLTHPLRLFRESLDDGRRKEFDRMFSGGGSSEEVLDMAAGIRDAGFDRMVRQEADAYLEKARRAVLRLPDGPDRDMLLLVTDHVRNRRN
ncbi:MAG: polyprenyl synthetase family protein [Desulfovibrio sp.]|jgi:octaprenyl-diphosphate synthase|nr:polyprenyl synthetase family protein [Desulfovibrio sp.]